MDPPLQYAVDRMMRHDDLPRALRLFLHEYNMPDHQIEQAAWVLKIGGKIEIHTQDGKRHKLGG
jgi:hypothetical protein